MKANPISTARLTSLWLSCLASLPLLAPVEAAGLLLNFGQFVGTSANFVNANERVDGATVDNNVRPFSTVGIASANAVLADDYSTLTLNAINLEINSPPIVIEGELDFGLFGVVPYTTSVSNIIIDVKPAGVVVPLSLSGGFAVTVPATYSWDAGLTIDGTTKSERLTDEAFFDIEIGDLDADPSLQFITMKLNGDSGARRNIYSRTVAGREVTLEHIVFIDRFNFSATTSPIPEPLPESLPAVLLLIGAIGLMHAARVRKNSCVEAKVSPLRG